MNDRNNLVSLASDGARNIGKSVSDMGDALPFVDFGTNVEIASIHLGSSSLFGCVILSKPVGSEQRIKCWGRNNVYQLGYGDTNNRGDNSGEMGDNLALVDLGSEQRVSSLSLGGVYTCAVLITNVLKCWGYGCFGQFNDGKGATISTMGTLLPTVVLESGRTLTLFGTGNIHNCFVYEDLLTMKCVGGNDYGQLGQGDNLQRGASPTTVLSKLPAINLGTGSLQISSIRIGQATSCVIFVDYSVKCFGTNNGGQFAIGSQGYVGDSPYETGSNLTFSKFFTPPTLAPTGAPSLNPTSTSPSVSPTLKPTKAPTQNPTTNPTRKPSNPPTLTPTSKPTTAPATVPTHNPTSTPIAQPSFNPTIPPSRVPTSNPSNHPTSTPTKQSDYQSAKSCKYDYNCMWKKVGDTKQCVVFDCTVLSKGKCGKERKKCKWDKKESACITKKK